MADFGACAMLYFDDISKRRQERQQFLTDTLYASQKLGPKHLPRATKALPTSSLAAPSDFTVTAHHFHRQYAR